MPQLDYKRLALILGIFLIAGIFAYLIYLFFFAPVLSPIVKTNTNTTPVTGLPETNGNVNRRISNTNDSTGLPYTNNINNSFPTTPDDFAQGGLTTVNSLVDFPVQNFGFNGNTGQFYDPAQQKFYRVDAGGNLTLLSDKKFYNVSGVTWSNQGDKAILDYPDGSNVYYNFSQDKQVTLPKHWQDFSFAPTGEQIVLKSMGTESNNRWLAIANPDGSGAKPVEELGDEGAFVHSMWSPNNQIIANYVTASAAGKMSVYFIGQNKENFPVVTVLGMGFEEKWSPTGADLLYSTYGADTDYKPNLWIVNANTSDLGSGRKNLKINTWAKKCAFSPEDTNMVYCAVPAELPTGSALNPDIASNVPDTFYKINLTTGMKSILAYPEGSWVADKVSVSSDNKYLYFTDKNTGSVQQIKLKP